MGLRLRKNFVETEIALSGIEGVQGSEPPVPGSAQEQGPVGCSARCPCAGGRRDWMALCSSEPRDSWSPCPPPPAGSLHLAFAAAATGVVGAGGGGAFCPGCGPGAPVPLPLAPAAPQTPHPVSPPRARWEAVGRENRSTRQPGRPGHGGGEGCGRQRGGGKGLPEMPLHRKCPCMDAAARQAELRRGLGRSRCQAVVLGQGVPPAAPSPRQRGEKA